MDTVLLCSAYLPPVSFFTAINSGGDVLIEQYIGTHWNRPI